MTPELPPGPPAFARAEPLRWRGVLNVNKPTGISSYDVIRRLKPLLPRVKLGHAGTLDPLAQGVLLVLVGEATKIADLTRDWDKEYEAVVLLGCATDTDDITGSRQEERAVEGISEEQVVAALAGFRGEIEQTPPVFSAVKADGVRAYRRARAGQTPQLKSRRVQVRELELTGFELPRVRLRARVSSGTYIRSLARDLGKQLGCGACLEELVRTRVGALALENALVLDTLDLPGLERALVPIRTALAALPFLAVRSLALQALRNGQRILPEDIQGPVPDIPDRSTVLLGDAGDRILTVARYTAGVFHPQRGIYADL